MLRFETLAVALVTAYGFTIIVLVVFQSRLQYFPDRRRSPIAQSGLTGGEELVLATSDGESLVAWHFRPRGERATILYFHGASGALINRSPRLRMFVERGYGVLAISYRGYGGSTGRPTQGGLIRDAETAYHAARLRYHHDRLIIMGASLGTGVAVSLAANHQAAGLVLLAPFLSAPDIVLTHFPFLPARWLMVDQFRSDLLISDVKMPLFMIHGERDRLVPIESGKRLFQLAKVPKTFLAVPGGGHVVLTESVFPRLCDWIDRAVAARSAAPQEAPLDEWVTDRGLFSSATRACGECALNPLAASAESE